MNNSTATPQVTPSNKENTQDLKKTNFNEYLDVTYSY
jgi:hypothetical protein